MSAPLRHREFRYLLTGQTVSALGDWTATFAMMVLVLDLTGSSAAVGGMLVLRLLPATLAGPLATRSVRRWNRRLTMIVVDSSRAVVALLVPLVAAAWWVYVCAFLLEVGGLVFLPARDASTPDLVDAEDLPSANGLVLGSSYGMIPLGAGAFGLLVAVHLAIFGRSGPLGDRPYALVFLFDAASFLVSVACVMRLRSLDARPSRRVSTVGPAASWTALTEPEAERGGGFLEAFRIPLVRTVVPAAVLVTLGLGTLFSVGVAFVRDVLDASNTRFGVLIVLFGVGAAVGLALPRALRGRDQIVLVRAGVVFQGVVVALISLSPGFPPALLGAGALGAATSLTLVTGMSALQVRLGGNERVYAFAAFHVVIRAGLSVAAVGAGVAVDLLGSVRWPLVGRLEPARVVLLCSGLVVLAGATMVREPGTQRVRLIRGRIGHH